jgi:hypothetical protein
MINIGTGTFRDSNFRPSRSCSAAYNEGWLGPSFKSAVTSGVHSSVKSYAAASPVESTTGASNIVERLEAKRSMNRPAARNVPGPF